MERLFTVGHFDADAFFASVEQALNPALRGKTIAVGGTTRGIISSASYEARAKGVRTPMPTSQALRVCPGLILIKGSYGEYARFSDAIFRFANDITPYVEQTSVDEGYLDLTPCRGDPVELMRGFAARVERELGVTVSVGVASNKLVAAVASKWKKPNGFTVVERGKEAAFLADMAVSVLPFVGPKTEKSLQAEGFFYVRDIQRAAWEDFEKRFGSGARELYDAAMGIDERTVKTEHEAAKSVSEQTTFARDTADFDFVQDTLKRMLDRLLTQLRQAGQRARTVTIRLRYPDWENRTFARSLPEASDLESDFYPVVAPLLREGWKRRSPVRLVGIKLSNFSSGVVQADLFGQANERRRALARASDALNERSPDDAPLLTRASHLGIPSSRERPRF